MNEEKKIEDGGPAFPHEEGERAGGFADTHPGKTLRDDFAGLALLGILSGRGDGHLTAGERAAWAYELADAMIAQRSKPC